MDIKELKKIFFTYRNGMLADTLRKSGYPHKIIYGLNIPQISSIAKDLIQDYSLSGPNASKSLGIIECVEPQNRNTITHNDSKTLNDVAIELWNDREVRESRLLATYLFNKEDISESIALQLSKEVRTPEEADMLAFRLLRYLPFAHSLLQTLEKDNSTPCELSASSLKRHLE